MTDAFVVPFAGARPAQAFAALPMESLADGIGSSYGIIGYKGKTWSLRYRGEKHVFVRQDDGTQASFIDVIILRSPAVKSKSYYPREEGYDPNSDGGKRPTCSALDGITPDTDIAIPQATACAICPRNEWKVDANGRKSRDCADAKRLAVLILPSLTKALLGSPLLEPVYLRVPPASLQDLGVMGETMDKQGFHYSSFITRISFDPDTPHPKMIFRPIQQLTDAEGPVVLPMREDALALRITGEDVFGVGGKRPLAITHAPVAPAPQVTQQPVAPLVVQAAPVAPVAQPSLATAPVTRSPSPASSAPPVETGLTAAPAAAPAQPQQSVAPPAPAAVSPSNTGHVQVETGFGLSPAAVTATVKQSPILDLTANPPAAAVQTSEDVGMPSEADEGLDARVAALLDA